MTDRPTEPDVEALREALNRIIERFRAGHQAHTGDELLAQQAARCWLAHVEAREGAGACKWCGGTRQIVTDHPRYGPEVLPCPDCEEVDRE